MSDRRYGGVLAATVLLLGAGAAWAWLAMREGKLDRPLQLAGEGDATFTVRNRWQIRPDVAAYERYAAEDSVWRLSYATSDPYSRAAAGSWAPSPEQTLRDTVYRLTQAGRLAEAAAELEQWLRRHPNDRAAMLELARLELQLGQPDDAFARYRALLARGDDPALRREYAAALLAAGRYADAAREYGRLVAADSASVEPRLGLARALAWGDRAREAEPQLRWLAARLPGDTTVTAMLHAAPRTRHVIESSLRAPWVT